MDALLKQIDAAFDYRGHVTVTLKDGSAVEGYMFNRQLSSKTGEAPYVEIIVKNSSERRTLAVSNIACVALTGEDCAAGKSFEDHQKNKAKA
jgi:hypothetical protein